jgi:hypothetical protein
MGLNYYAIAVNDKIKEIVSNKWAKESVYNKYKRQYGKYVSVFEVGVDDYIRYNHGAKLAFIITDNGYKVINDD